MVEWGGVNSMIAGLCHTHMVKNVNQLGTGKVTLLKSLATVPDPFIFIVGDLVLFHWTCHHIRSRKEQ